MKKVLSYINRFLIIFFPLLFPIIGHALPFNIVPNGTLPTTVPSGGTVSASYIIQNNTISQRNNNFVKYLPPNVTVASGGTCTSPTFNLAAKGQGGDSCTLNLTISGAVNAKDPNPHNHLFVCLPGGMSCAGPNNPLNVTVVTQSTVARAYITDNTAGNVYVCDINNGGVFSGPCVTATATAIFNNPYGITLNTDGTKAYVAQFGVNGVYTCDIDQTTGLFTTCNLSTTSPISPLGIALNTDDSIGYLAANGNQNIYYCPPNDFSSGTCQSTDYINLVNPAGGPAPIQNVFPNNSISYVIDANAPTMYACNVNINGSFSSCSATGSNLNFPNGIAINPAGTFLYLTNSPNSVTTCDVTTLPSCNGTTTGFDQPYGIAVNGTGTFVYVVNRASKNISVCSIQNNGSLANCKIAGDLSASGLPQSIVISPNLS